MRFHIGFSKHIKTSVIIKFLIALGFLILATLGMNKVNAETLNHFNFRDLNSGTYNATLTGSYTYAMTTSPNNDVDVYDVSLYEYIITQGGSIRNRYFCFSSSCDSTQSLFGYTFIDHTTNYQGNAMRVFKNASFGYSNENYCSVNDYKSNELYVYLRYGNNNDSSQSGFISANNFTPGDFWEMKFNAIDENGEFYVTYCSYIGEQVINSEVNEAIYNCPYTFIGNDQVIIDRYSIDVFNKLTQDGTYNKPNSWNYIYTAISIDLMNTTYECSSHDPVIDFSTIPLPSGPSVDQFLEEAHEHFESVQEGASSNYILLGYPSNMAEVLALPLNLVHGLFEASDICTPFELDVSSIASAWGGSNSETIVFPCMRETLTDLLGENIYTLVDLLMCFFVSYKILSTIILYIEAVTSGEDIFTLLFKGDKSSIYDYNKE